LNLAGGVAGKIGYRLGYVMSAAEYLPEDFNVV
jgi:hypothetical protein